MNTSQSKISPQEAIANMELFSSKIDVRFLRVIEEISTSLDKFEIVNDEDKKLFLNAINYHYNDLCAAIFHLRQIMITISDGDHQILRNVVIQLNRIAFAMQEALNLETEMLKDHLDSHFILVSSQVEKLMKVVECDNQQDYKQKIVDIQLDILTSVGAFKLYLQHPNPTISEWEMSVHDSVEKLRTNLSQIKSGHELLVEDFSHYTRVNLQNLHNKVDYLRKVRNTNNFPTGVATTFENCEAICTHFIAKLLESLLHDNPMKAMLDTIDECHKLISKTGVELQESIKPIMEKHDIENEMTKQIVIYMMICGMNLMHVFNQSIEDAVMKK